MNFHEIVAKFKHYWYNKKKHLQREPEGIADRGIYRF